MRAPLKTIVTAWLAFALAGPADAHRPATSGRTRKAAATTVSKLTRRAGRRNIIRGQFKMPRTDVGFVSRVIKGSLHGDPRLLPVTGGTSPVDLMVDRAGTFYERDDLKDGRTWLNPLSFDEFLALDLQHPGLVETAGRSLARHVGMTMAEEQAFLANLGALELPLGRNVYMSKLVDSPGLRAGLWQTQKMIDGETQENGRGIKNYASLLGRVGRWDFREFLETLPPGSHWLDGGAGTAFAIRQVVGSKNTRMYATAVTATLYKNISWILVGGRKNLNYVYNTPLVTLRSGMADMANVASDVYGGFLYEPHWDLAIATYGAWLKPGGYLFTHVPSQVLPTLRDPSGHPIAAHRYVEKIRGFDIKQLDFPERNGKRRFDRNYPVVLRRNHHPLEVPSLTLVEYRLLTRDPPPWRSYIVDGGMITVDPKVKIGRRRDGSPGTSPLLWLPPS